MRQKLLFIAGMFFLLAMPVLLFAQTKTLTGTVVTEKNGPVQGATIALKNNALVTVSDANGKFTISIPNNAIITVSAIGYKAQTIDVSRLSTIQVKLAGDVANLDEVVVTGLATTVKRKNLANAVAVINAKTLNGTAPAQTFDAALEGKIPGAYINANSGAPGGGISVKLRGVTSVFGNTQPLYVVDGVFVDNTATSGGLNAVTSAGTTGATSNQDNPSSRIADLRAEDIESIEILKGASAAAIYGSKASGGVVIINTKRGKQGKTNISLSQDVGFLRPIKLLGVRKFTAQTAATLPGDSATLTNQFLAAQSAGHIYDYEKEIYDHTPFLRNTVLTMNGGNEKTGFYFSVAQKDENGLVQRTGYKNTSVRLNLDHKVSDNIKLGISTNYINSSADRGLFGNDNAGVTTGIALSSTPGFAQLHPDKDGNYPANPFAASNPLQTIALMQNNESVNRFITGANLDVMLQKSNSSVTKFIGRGGIDFYNLQTSALFPSILQFEAINKGMSVQGSTKNLSTNFILSLVNTFTASSNLSLTTSGGLTRETGDYNNLLNVATQVIAGQSNVDQAGALNATQLRTKYLNQGFFLQEEALIANAITLTGGLRLDRSSNNGNVAKYYFYPKAGLSVNLTDLGVIKQGLFDNIKLRAAYGQANNVPAYGSKFTSMGVSNIGGYPGLLVNTQEGDPAIKPERQTELETGIDFSLLKGRLGFELTYYHKNIRDFLLLTTPPASSGYAQQWTNAGNLTNHGIELGLNAKPVALKDVVWNTSVNFWFNRSKITKLTVPPVQLGSTGGVLLGTFQIEQGKSATQIVGLNGKGIGVLGDTEPTFQMNTYNEVTFFNKLSLRFLIHWKKGGQNVNVTSLQNVFGGTSATYDNPSSIPHVPYGVSQLMKIGSDAHQTVETSTYLRFREIGLYYTFNKLPGTFVKSINVGASLNNYFTITKYKGYDPEVSNFGTGFSSGVDIDPYPSSKRAALHVSFNF
ncbi:SusC/RagA family TonB-linked outer membrane protein [Mucilaginibacter sp. SMC90]|uniref:SusC/RagA family TonB-linked outer membrane protein n=1 Tax=Mucilaginibacter sp. SMC90 TaxID=2929803 RepID=UPI001FB2E216|nr:SusC/RagA family TonB-linked outer membrane protein [Mucilaginibacter sp. SMC90]UOE47478.1 SusC/RagA family TonB-linked outer membrane protein [Mucilaginibacter sp. SMC90]